MAWCSLFVLNMPLSTRQTNTQTNGKKMLRETQTLRAGCSKVEPKIFCPATDPFPWAWDSLNLFSWRWSVPLPTNPVWWGSMHAISSNSGNRPTNTHKQTNWQTGPITIHCAAKLSAQCCHQPKNGSLADSEGKLCRVLLVMMVVLLVMLVLMPNLSMLYTVVPDHNADDDGLRRSKRVRVRPLEWYRCERIAYQWDNSGMIYYLGILLCLDLNLFMHSVWLRVGCRNAWLTIWLANRRLTLTARLPECLVARSTVNQPFC